MWHGFVTAALVAATLAGCLYLGCSEDGAASQPCPCPHGVSGAGGGATPGGGGAGAAGGTSTSGTATGGQAAGGGEPVGAVGAGAEGGAGAGPPGPTCGNGLIETGEECDDGNATSGDGCTGCVVDCSPAPGNPVGEFKKHPITHHCYFISWPASMGGTTSSWLGAQSLCKSIGSDMDLAGISSGEEFGYIIQEVPPPVWIGGHDLVVEGSYQWVNGEPWGYAAWGYQQPSTAEMDDCVMYSEGYFKVYQCYVNYRYLCERVPAGS